MKRKRKDRNEEACPEPRRDWATSSIWFESGNFRVDHSYGRLTIRSGDYQHQHSVTFAAEHAERLVGQIIAAKVRAQAEASLKEPDEVTA